MEKKISIEIFPDYGWGWRKGYASVSVPSPFVTEMTEFSGDTDSFDKATGIVTSTPPHELNGYYVILIRRGISDEGSYYNICLRMDGAFQLDKVLVDAQTITGFARARIC